MGLYLIPTRPPCFLCCRLARSFADNNIADCGYDGGDCCSCDCTDVRATASGDYYCDYSGYDCLDVDSACYGEPQCSARGDLVSNGYCNAGELHDHLLR
ncbi:unnamed protein product [Ectocarpus fasciculatus]